MEWVNGISRRGNGQGVREERERREKPIRESICGCNAILFVDCRQNDMQTGRSRIALIDIVFDPDLHFSRIHSFSYQGGLLEHGC